MILQQVSADRHTAFIREYTRDSPYLVKNIIGKYPFVNRTITDWNKLPEGAIGTSHGKTHICKTRVWKVKTVRGSEGDKK